MKSISLYKFITAFCLVPVNDWGAFVQRLVDKVLKIWLVTRLISFLSKPIFFVGLAGLMIIAPEFFVWIFIKIGEFEIVVMSIMLNAVMPDLFGSASGQYSSWAQLWSQGLSALPADMVEVMNSLGIAQLLGYITSTYGAIFVIKTIRGAFKRARLI